MWTYPQETMELLIFTKEILKENLMNSDDEWKIDYPRPCKVVWTEFVGNEAKGRISKRVLEKNESGQIFRITNISYSLIRTCSVGKKCSFFRKVWRALFTCNTRFEIRPFALLPKN